MSSKSSPVLIVHLLYRLDVGGLENGVVNLINHLPHDRFRHAIICLSDFSPVFRRRIQRADVQIYALNKREGTDIGMMFRLWSLLRDLKPQILHSRNLAALEGQLSGCLARVPIRIHGEHGWDVADPDGKSSKFRFIRRLYKRCVHHFIPLSVELEHYLVNAIKIPDSRMSRIYNGVNLGDFYPASGDVLHVFPKGFANQDTTVIGTVGRMHGVKNQMTLVRAFIALVKLRGAAGAGLRLVLIGDGPIRTEAEALLVTEGVREQVWMPGERDDVAECMRAMKIFVLPSTAEGISNTILEAMGCGLPVVASDVGGNSELVTEETGTLVEASNTKALVSALKHYLDHPDIATAHGMAGRLRVKKSFSLEAMVSRYQNVYENMLAGKVHHVDEITGSAKGA